eukprot:evm.model.scf_3664.1 EVM.evm.TU.scf_3664.1   scf_3664:1961-7119(+)
MACACAALYFLNLRGDVLIQRTYRDDVERNLADTFRSQILQAKDNVNPSPVRTLGSVTFLYMRQNDVYIVMVTRTNANAMLAFKFMTSLVQLFKSYFGGTFSENAIKNNFVLIYELLDETIDFGYPQITDPATMKSFIFQKGVRVDVDTMLAHQNTETWVPQSKHESRERSCERISGKQWISERFVVTEDEQSLCRLVLGSTLRSDVNGRIMMKCFLSGMPELKLGLNEKLGDMTFHQCVNLAAFESQKVVTFIPPDGEFELMKYRVQDGINVPFKVLPVINEHGRTRVEANVTIKSNFSSALFALNVVVTVPVPGNTSKATTMVTAGRAKYDATKNAIIWKIRRFSGQFEHTLRAEVVLVSTLKEKKAWARPPISMQFLVPMFSASGMRVQYLKILERKWGSQYKVDKWVRKICKSGDFLVRW